MAVSELPLRYGVNPHQRPARAYAEGGLPFEVVNGVPGYINLLDALNAWQLVRELADELRLPAAASFKHVSPAGAAVAVPLDEDEARAAFVSDLDLSPIACAYARARGADRMSSFGDFIAVSEPVDASLARLVRREVSDGIIAPGYDDDALEILRQKRGGKYLALRVDPAYEPPPLERRDLFGVTLEQPRNAVLVTRNLFGNIVSRSRDLPEEPLRDLVVATVALKYTQSNSVCLAARGQTIGIGAGQQSRIHCTRLAADKADVWHLRHHPKALSLEFVEGTSRPDMMNAVEQYVTGNLQPAQLALFRLPPPPFTDGERREWLAGRRGAVLSSDAFFPFRDSIDRAARSGVRYVAEPGGSERDSEVVAACDEHGMTLCFTGLRLFHH